MSKCEDYYEEGQLSLAGAEREHYTEYLYNWANDPVVTKYLVTGLYPSNKDKMSKLYDEVNNGNNVVLVIKHNGHPSGLVGLYNINWQASHAEFRIIIGDTTLYGMGIGTKCVKFMVNYAFNNLNLNKVYAGINEENIGSLKIFEKTGFTREGVLRQEIFRNGRYYDAVRVSILKSENEEKPKI